METSNLNFAVTQKVYLYCWFINCHFKSSIPSRLRCPHSLCAWVVSDYVWRLGLVLNSTLFHSQKCSCMKRYVQVWVVNNPITTLKSIAIWLSDPSHPCTKYQTKLLDIQRDHWAQMWGSDSNVQTSLCLTPSSPLLAFQACSLLSSASSIYIYLLADKSLQ